MTNFKDKANLFNDFFSKHCHPIPNNSSVPSIQTFETSSRPSTVDIDITEILKLIPLTKHTRDSISNRMLKLCGSSIIKLFSLLFSNCFEDWVFPDNWKKANVIPVHKKGNKQLVSSYRPLSPLSICSKIFEKLYL